MIAHTVSTSLKVTHYYIHYCIPPPIHKTYMHYRYYSTPKAVCQVLLEKIFKNFGKQLIVFEKCKKSMFLAVKLFEQLIYINGLCNKVVHAAGEGFIALFGKGVCGAGEYFDRFCVGAV